ncbi:MAG TPA: hypothetical protein VF898_06820 [Chloroflexota bacterium]
MSSRGCLLLILVASTLVADITVEISRPPNANAYADMQSTETGTPVSIPTVQIPESTPVSVPTLTLPQPTSTPTPTVVPRHKVKRVPKHRRPAPVKRPTAIPQQWIWAYLTSYCPASAGSMSSNGSQVFYGMLANNYYPYGTHVYLPVLGITGVVEDRIGSMALWNHFDVWSPVCYSTPTGWFRVAVRTAGS